jgi:hypothetical protein
MKSILVVFFVTAFFALPLQAADGFPVVGSSYRVFYAIKPDAGAFSPNVVKILKKGSGGWVFIEAKHSSGDVVSFWLNFDHLLSATEIQQAEQGGTGQPATRPESKLEGNDKPQL